MLTILSLGSSQGEISSSFDDEVPESARGETTLRGVSACQEALEKVSVEHESVTEVIADCCSSTYSCPAEACRIAAGLSLKVPAYDCNTGSVGSLALLETIFNRKEQEDDTSSEENALLVSTVDAQHFSATPFQGRFISGAGAALVTRKQKPGIYTVLAVQTDLDASLASWYANQEADTSKLDAFFERWFIDYSFATIEKVQKSYALPKNTTLFLDCSVGNSNKFRECFKERFPEYACYSGKYRGEYLGASLFMSLAEVAEKSTFSDYTHIIACCGGYGIMAGFILLTKKSGGEK